MGIWLSRMLSFFGEKEARILVLGLDNAGKTTILCELLRLWARSSPQRRIVEKTPLSPDCWVVAAHSWTHADRLQVGEVVSTIPSGSQLLLGYLGALHGVQCQGVPA